MSTWKPGDVAMVTWEEPSGRSTIESTERAEFTGAAWVWVGGMIQPEWVAFARPLVVIDPEDTEAVKRLVSLYNRQFPISDGPEDAEAMADALREFANPTPPKCSAHGDAACTYCSRIASEHLTEDGGCTSCSTYAIEGMHWDTCPGRLRGSVFASRDEAVKELRS